MTIEQFNQQYGNDPAFLQLVSAQDAEAQGGQYPGALSAFGPAGKALRQFIASKGVDTHNTLLRPSTGGGVELYDTHPGREFAKDAAISAGIVGGGALALNALAPPAATDGSTTLGAAGPLAADETFTAGPIAGTGLAGVDVSGLGTAAASTGFGAALKAALPTIIGAGANVGGAAIASHGNTEAAKIAAAEQDKALAQAKEIYEQNVARQKPFVDLGTSSLSSLAQGLGLPAPAAAAANPAPSTGVAAGAVDASGQPLPGASTAPYVVPPTAAQQGHPAGSYDATGQPMSTLNQVGTGSTVRIQNPQTGLVHLVPAAEVPALLQAGGVRV